MRASSRTWLVIAFVLPLTAAAAAQTPPSADDATIGASLKRLQFEAAATVDRRPDLNRPLTNSASIVSGVNYIVAYYFDDETMYGQLGPLHVSRFDGEERRWQHSREFASEVIGTIRRLNVQGRYLLVELESNPSAGGGLVLDGTALAPVRFVLGRGFEWMANGALRFSGNMDHLKAARQQTLRVSDPVSGLESEVFPGAAMSPAAVQYRDAAQGNFNRAISDIAEADDGRRLAFRASYTRSGAASGPPLTTAVACAQSTTATAWSCTERAID